MVLKIQFRANRMRSSARSNGVWLHAAEICALPAARLARPPKRPPMENMLKVGGRARAKQKGQSGAVS